MPRVPRFRYPVIGATCGLLTPLAVAALIVFFGGGPDGTRRVAGFSCARIAVHRGLATHESGPDTPTKGPEPEAAGGCGRGGGPERFRELDTAATELQARDTAPFASQASGAYRAALVQRARMPRAGAFTGRANDTTGNSWTLAGTPPECAGQTSDGGRTCPAPSAENGDYSNIGSLGFRTLSGRISAIAYDPGSSGRFLASPTAGGVWETTDAGAHWHPIGDPLPTQVVGAIAYDAPLHRILAGTGDNSFGGTGIPGHGIYESDDDGAHWKAASGIPDLALSFKLVVSAADPSGRTVYAATSRGLFRSTDGGGSFANVALPTSPPGSTPNCAGDTAERRCFFANIVTDVLVKPTATANGPAGAVIAAVGWRAGQKKNADGSVQSPQNGLYTSTSGAPGSFSYISPTGAGGNGLPDTAIFGRTALAVARGAGQNSDAVYALVEDAQKFQGCPDVLDRVPPSCNSTVTGTAIATVLNGLFASYDFGKSWTKVMDSTQLKQPGTNSALLGNAGYSPGIQSWYNLWVEPDPTVSDVSGNPTRVLFGLEEVWENNPLLPSGGSAPSVLATPYAAYPGGSAANDPWVVIGRYWNACGGVNTPVPCNQNPTVANPVPGTTTHPDHHAVAFVPDGHGGVTLLIGSDGGAFAQHVDSGGQFSNDNWGDGLNATISAVQPYDAEMSKDGTIVSGLQDNGEMKIAPSGREAEIFGGDAFWTPIDPGNSQNIIEEYTYANQVNLSRDGGSNWYPIQPGSCSGSASDALFSTPIEQDPTTAGHLLLGCTQIQEATNAFADPCAVPPGADASTCQLVNSPFNTTFDLGTLPGGAPNIPSALAVRGANEYAAYCSNCDPAVQKTPFANGIATNVGGSAPPKIGAADGWHQAKANCTNCGTANGKLPNRYINSIQEDPSDPGTVYVTLGGYGRRWIPPGSFNEDISNVGHGHLFVSHDHADTFTDITGNLPDISANWTVVHNGNLVVATDLGMFVQLTHATSPTYGILGTGLPMAPVFTARQTPADPDKLLIATYGRGDWVYSFKGGAGSGGGVPAGSAGSAARLCAKPSGRLSAGRLGPIRIGQTRALARRAAHLALVRAGFDVFCLRGGPGIRAGYPTRRLLRGLSHNLRRRVSGKVVLAMTGNRYYSYHRARPGAKVRSALRGLPRGTRLTAVRVGANRWYVLARGSSRIVLKTLRGRVVEIGVTTPLFTASPAATVRFLRSF